MQIRNRLARRDDVGSYAGAGAQEGLPILVVIDQRTRPAATADRPAAFDRQAIVGSSRGLNGPDGRRAARACRRLASTRRHHAVIAAKGDGASGLVDRDHAKLGVCRDVNGRS